MIAERSHNLLATRADADLFDAMSDLHPDLRYNALGRTIVLEREPVDALGAGMAIVTAGTADLPVAEEAAETARLFGAPIHTYQRCGCSRRASVGRSPVRSCGGHGC